MTKSKYVGHKVKYLIYENAKIMLVGNTQIRN